MSADLASRPYAALKLYILLQRTSSERKSAVSQSLGLKVHSQLNILGSHPERITIDPYWQDTKYDLFEGYEAAKLKIRSRCFSTKARSRESCLNEIVDDLAITFLESGGYIRARSKRERLRERPKIDALRQDLKAMYLSVFFCERPRDVLAGNVTAYTASRVLQIAKTHEIDIPPDRKLQLEVESRTDHSDPRDLANAWLESCLESRTSKVRLAAPSEIRSVRRRLLRKYNRDILQLYVIWQITSTSIAKMASLFLITAEQARFDILLVVKLKLLRPVKHKLDRLEAVMHQTISSFGEGSFPHQPTFKATSDILSRIESLNTGNTADEVAVASPGSSAESAAEEFRSIAGPCRRKEEAAVAAAAVLRERRRKRRREKPKASKTTNSAALKSLKPVYNFIPYTPSTRPEKLTRDIVREISQQALEEALAQNAHGNGALESRQHAEIESNKQLSQEKIEEEQLRSSKQSPFS